MGWGWVVTVSCRRVLESLWSCAGSMGGGGGGGVCVWVAVSCARVLVVVRGVYGAVRVTAVPLPGLVTTVFMVRLDVFAEVVTAHESLVAHGAGEALLSRVRAQMTLQLIRARESLATEEPVADKGSLTGVPAEVSLQVRRLVVHLAAAGDVAAVDIALPESLTRRPQAVSLLAVGTAAVGSARIPPRRSGRDWRNPGQKRSRQRGADFRLRDGWHHCLVRLSVAGEEGRGRPERSHSGVVGTRGRCRHGQLSGGCGKAAGHRGHLPQPGVGVAVKLEQRGGRACCDLCFGVDVESWPLCVVACTRSHV